MLLMAKIVATNLWVSPICHCQTEDYIRCNNGFVSFQQSSRISLVSSDSYRSCAAIKASWLLNQTISQPVTDCNTHILKFCQVSNLKMAMDLLCKSQKSELELATYCSVLQLCADLKSLQNGRKVHSIIESNGLEIESVLGSKLVFMYLSCGDLAEGRRIFNKIRNEKVFLWNMIINEYAKIGDFEESILLFEWMQQLGVEANSYTFSCVLKCFAAKGSVGEGEQVHGYLLRLGFGSYTAVVNSLIGFYFKCGKTESARKLFDELTDQDVITWNSMISGYVANGLAESGVEVFIEMLSLGIGIDLATIVNVLAACANLGTILVGRALHAYAIKAGFSEEVKINNTLLNMYSKCGDIDSANQVFKSMPERSIVSWTSMIAGYARDGRSDKAMALFREIKTEGIKPDMFAVTTILDACACSGSLESGKEVHDYITENDMLLNISVSNALIHMYAKCGSMEDAHSIFTQMPIKDIISWNTMIGGYSKNSLPDKALELFVSVQPEIKPDNVTMTSILPACSSLAALDRGREIHGHILRNGFYSDKYVANALVDMYVKCGALVLARSLFDMIPVKDLVSWTVMVAGYCMHGFGSEAMATFNEMRRTCVVNPNEVSFVSILYACSHSGLLDEGWRFFNIMRNECNIEPKLEHYSCMVDLLACTGKLSKAYRFIETMPIEPDATIWGALLRGCRIHHDVKLAEKVAERVFELEPIKTGNYVLLANIYAEAETWEKVKSLKEKISQRGVRKNQGCSWIEIRGKVHIFVAGYNSHPEAKKIESLLKKIRMKMKKECCIPKLRYALMNADNIEKEVAHCGHTEKLAMAFGMLSLPPDRAIRLTKNVRVCGDCHEMAKFMSKSFGREIVLRDSNRFHHFKEGSCSCRG
ncbi:pentatricopeptide repeat-containing protein DOT4, chloroplastic [Diospyros lotus]|uniref:pentatricopeptide repeat-containing protein DOT4, chloroplastic n=1 Tax=Diospyros lotus TaxID=55363 RepID=UPI002256FB44|nr:pentatricopeptide repeat-containing protein DOT4, chloroplastic [Diospyros lotus]